MVNEAAVTGTAAPAASTTASIATKTLAAAKMAVLSPAAGAVAIIGIIAVEWWMGSRDAKKFADAKKATS